MKANLDPLRRFVEEITGDASWRSIAAATGIETSTLTRQFKRGRVSASTVVAIARAYHADLLEALVLAGFITGEEATSIEGRGALQDASDLQLAEEILRRAQIAADEGTDSASAGMTRRSSRSARWGSSQDFADDAAASHSTTSVHDEAQALASDP